MFLLLLRGLCVFQALVRRVIAPGTARVQTGGVQKYPIKDLARQHHLAGYVDSVHALQTLWAPHPTESSLVARDTMPLSPPLFACTVPRPSLKAWCLAAA